MNKPIIILVGFSMSCQTEKSKDASVPEVFDTIDTVCSVSEAIVINTGEHHYAIVSTIGAVYASIEVAYYPVSDGWLEVLSYENDLDIHADFDDTSGQEIIIPLPFKNNNSFEAKYETTGQWSISLEDAEGEACELDNESLQLQNVPFEFAEQPEAIAWMEIPDRIEWREAGTVSSGFMLITAESSGSEDEASHIVLATPASNTLFAFTPTEFERHAGGNLHRTSTGEFRLSYADESLNPEIGSGKFVIKNPFTGEALAADRFEDIRPHHSFYCEVDSTESTTTQEALICHTSTWSFRAEGDDTSMGSITVPVQIQLTLGATDDSGAPLELIEAQTHYYIDPLTIYPDGYRNPISYNNYVGPCFDSQAHMCATFATFNNGEIEDASENVGIFIICDPADLSCDVYSNPDKASDTFGDLDQTDPDFPHSVYEVPDVAGADPQDTQAPNGFLHAMVLIDTADDGSALIASVQDHRRNCPAGTSTSAIRRSPTTSRRRTSSVAP